MKTNKEDDNLYAPIEAYKERFPKAQDPMDFISSFGSQTLNKIIKEANGKEIIFERPDHQSERVTYTFK